jgi:hypothetical protein
MLPSSLALEAYRPSVHAMRVRAWQLFPYCPNCRRSLPEVGMMFRAGTIGLAGHLLLRHLTSVCL